MTLATLSEMLSGAKPNQAPAQHKFRAKEPAQIAHLADGSVLWTNPRLTAGLQPGCIFVHPALLSNVFSGRA